MGMVICTFVTCPIGSCVGCVLGACGGRTDVVDKKVLLGAFCAVFAAGCICYIALSILCAKADGDHWTLIRSEGECWSEGGTMPFWNLGWWTGALIGVGFFGMIVMLYRIHQARKEKQTLEETRGDYDQLENVV